MTSHPRTVFILGAGFTKAFLPQAPLLTDDYEGDFLAAKFEQFPHARRIIEQERARNCKGQLNVERLMTRLDGPMPYDFEQGVSEELGLLLTEVKCCFARRLETAKSGPFKGTELAAFARYCVENAISCVTFNYDDVFDQALWEVFKVRWQWEANQPYWHPDGGYGFFCKPSELCVHETPVFMDRSAMLLLKLHGSLNWRIRRGHSRPYGIDAVVHDELWLPFLDGTNVNREAIALHLQPEPFIVPPVLMKSALVEQPILRLV